MPRSSLKGFKKSRKGCFTCKKRKKKCDETKPICSTCLRLKLKCNYGIKLNWLNQNQFSIKIQTNQEKTENKTNKKKIYFINFLKWDMIVSYKFNSINSNQNKIYYDFKLENYESDFKTEEEYKYDINSLTSGILSKFELENLQKNSDFSSKINEQFLFNLYIEVLSRTKSFTRNEYIPNDFIHLVIPGCKKFPALYRSVLALSALDLIKNELCKEKNKRDEFLITIYNSLFIEYKNDALNYLHFILDDFNIEVVEMLEELVITILILCNIEITNRGNKEWIRYLTEASLIFSALTMEKIENSNIFKFAYKYFTLRYFLLITTLDYETLNLFLENTPWPIINNLFLDENIEPMFGCSPKLLFIIYKITNYNYLFENKEIENHEFIGKLTKLWYKLDLIKQKDIYQCKELKSSANCYFLATKIYIYTILIKNKLNHFLDDKFDKYIPKLWEQLTHLSLSKKSLFFPNWCFFIIITNDIVNNEDEKRIKTLKLFNSLQNNWPLSSVVKIRKAIESIWKIYDLSIKMDANGYNGIKDVDRMIAFDCRQVLKQYQYMLALT